jgi:hypothetical protein
MFRAGLVTYTGGLVVIAFLSIVTILLERAGVSFWEAIYLSVLGLTSIGYGITEWRVRQEKSDV